MRAPALLLPLLLACSPSAGPGSHEGQRVIALAPSITRVLQEVGAADALVAVDSVSHELPGLGGVASVGGLWAPDLERTIELRPTLVLAVHSAQLAPYLAELERRGVRVVEIEPYTLAEVLASFAELGALVGRPRAGRELAARVRAELDAVAAAVRGRERPSVALVLERDPLYVAGGGGFTHDLIEAAGGRNVFGDLGAPYPRVSLESLAERAPDVLIDTTAGAGPGPRGSEEVREYWARFSWMRRVEPLDRAAVTLPGPDLGAGARALAGRVHAEPALAAGDPLRRP